MIKPHFKEVISINLIGKVLKKPAMHVAVQKGTSSVGVPALLELTDEASSDESSALL